jgi:hypothetical protein
MQGNAGFAHERRKKFFAQLGVEIPHLCRLNIKRAGKVISP